MLVLLAEWFFKNCNNDWFTYSSKILDFVLVQNIISSSVMKRNSIKKASTFKLQASRNKFNSYLEDIDSCPVARKFPSHIENIRSSSEALFDICYNFRDDSPFIRGLNYDNRYFGFNSTDNRMTYHDYIAGAKEVYLLGDFNDFDKNKHRLEENEEMGKGWFKLEFDLNEHRLDEGSRLLLRVLDAEGKEWTMPPPSCRFVSREMGIFRKYHSKVQHFSKHRISQLLAYTIDLQLMPLEECLAFIQKEMDVLECFNTIILKNLFNSDLGLLHKFSLTPQRGDLLEQIVEKLAQAGVKVVLQWNHQSSQMRQALNPVEQEYFREVGSGEWQFDLQKQSVIGYYLSNIAHYFKQFGIGGIHFTRVHCICRQPNGTLLVKIINLLSERLSEASITLASSKECIPGLTEPILEGGLGFSFTYNFHQSLSLSQQHQNIYEAVKQIHSSSNCLSLSFSSLQPQDFIYLLFTFLISKKGVFTRGPIGPLKEELKKVLRLRRQEELFNEECTVKRIDEDCMIVQRGNQLQLFNFSQKQMKIDVDDLLNKRVIFSDNEEEPKMNSDSLMLSKLNCLVLQTIN